MSANAEQLVALIRSYGGCAVAFSAGVDSTVVAKAACLASAIERLQLLRKAIACLRANSTKPASWPG